MTGRREDRDRDQRDREERRREKTGRRADELRQSWRDHHPSEDEDEARRTREEISRLEEKRRRLSGEVMEGKPGALEEDEQLERRILELARRLEGGKA